MSGICSKHQDHDPDCRLCRAPDDRCTVPDCNAEFEFDAPGIWCREHWQMWWDWPQIDDPKEPAWFPKGLLDD